MGASGVFSVLLGGAMRATRRLKAKAAGTRVIAADSGIRHAEPLGLEPEFWLGDFDSSDAALFERWAQVPREEYPLDKDATDGEIAVEEALRRGAEELLLIGGPGGQIDHALGIFALCIDLKRRGISSVCSSGDEEIYPLVPGEMILTLPERSRVSVIGYSDLGSLTLEGVDWPLERRDVRLGSSLTLSNVSRKNVKVVLETGYGIVIAYPEWAETRT